MTQQKVRLRAMEPEDLDYLYRIENDNELWKVGVTNVPYSRSALNDYICTCTSDIYQDRQVRLMVETAGGVTVGIVDLVNFNPQHRRAEIGLVIDAAHRGQGYGGAAVAQLMRYAHEVLHLHQLYAVIAVGNGECVRLFERLRFQKDTMLKDWLFDGDRYHDALVMQTFL